MQREQVPLRVQIRVSGEDQPRWLAVDGTLGADEQGAAQFVHQASPTVAERHRIDVLVHELAGGLDAWLDLQQGIRNGHRAVLAELESQLWPGGRPGVQAAPDQAAQERALEKAWTEHSSRAMDGLATLRAMADRLEFLARWNVLWVSGPADWRSLADRELDDQGLVAVLGCWTAVHAEHALGKARRSGS